MGMEMEVTGEITGDGEEHLTVLKHASPQSFRLNPPPGLALVHLKRSLTTTASGSQVRSTDRYFRSGTSCCRPNLNSHFHKRCSSSNERCWSLGSCSFGCLYGPLRGR